MQLVTLVGTVHGYQLFLDADPGRLEFVEFLTDLCQKMRVDTIGEEFSTQALCYHTTCASKALKRQQNSLVVSKQSCAQIVANRLQIKHVFADPDDKERDTHGIPYNESSKREEFWVGRLKEGSSESVIFICGSKHIDTFSKRLRASRIDVAVASADWKPFDDNSSWNDY